MSAPRARASEVERATEVFFALGDVTRMSLLRRLGDGSPLSIAQLTEGTEVTRQAVTKHLRVLEGCGLVSNARRGREVRYALEPARLEAARSFLDRLSAEWDQALARLRAMVETDEDDPRRSRK
jgi:DNA-binding transcriptional ArsR family regulator